MVAESPRRSCVGCRRVRPKDELLRVAATPDGVRVDAGQHLPGRGAYVCPDPDCIEVTARRRTLWRALRTPTEAETSDVLDELRRAVRHGTTTQTTEDEPERAAARGDQPPTNAAFVPRGADDNSTVRSENA